VFTSPLSGYRLLRDHLVEVAESLIAESGGRSSRKGKLLFWMAVLWAVYVPLHELLHALGCVATGGEVQEIRLSVLFGGSLLERLFPMFQGEWSLGGRVSRFSTGGSDWVYLATDAAPYIPSVLFGVWLMQTGIRSQRTFVLAAGLILSLAPVISIPGDYYEMGSILTGNTAKFVLGIPPGSPMANSVDLLRSDDIILLIREIAGEQRDVTPLGTGRAFLLVVVSLGIGVWLAGATYWMSGRVFPLLRTRPPAGTDGMET
jgi:hypothetical protein